MMPYGGLRCQIVIHVGVWQYNEWIHNTCSSRRVTRSRGDDPVTSTVSSQQIHRGSATTTRRKTLKTDKDVQLGEHQLRLRGSLFDTFSVTLTGPCSRAGQPAAPRLETNEGYSELTSLTGSRRRPLLLADVGPSR